MSKPKHLTHEQMNSQNWRYKKKVAPIDEFVHLNGPVITTSISDRLVESEMPEDIQRAIRSINAPLPHPFKCSKCAYTAKTSADSRKHWFDEHR